MARPDKAAAVAELTERFSNAGGAVLTEYRGLTVKALKELRRSLGEDATYAVSKNTLTTIAARQAGVEGIDDLLVGPTAIAFIDGDPVVVAKGLRDFARNNPQLVIKGGVLDGKPLTPDEVRKLADLESREVLLGKAAGAMKGVLAQAVSLFAAPLSQAARLVAALEKAATENPALIAGAGAPAPAEEDTSEPSNDGLDQAAAASEPSNEELDRAAAVAEPATESAPAAGTAAEAAPAEDAAPAADTATDAAPAADENTTVAADAAEDK
jgi:large subunit ribosomal protein L10